MRIGDPRVNFQSLPPVLPTFGEAFRGRLQPHGSHHAGDATTVSSRAITDGPVSASGARSSSAPPVAAATLDRLRHNAYCLVLEGMSYRAPKPPPATAEPKVAIASNTAHS
jgi:hypothetical protein